jgi:hypothetical protein
MLSGKARSPGSSIELGVPSEHAGKAMVKMLASRIANMIKGCLTFIITHITG